MGAIQDNLDKIRAREHYTEQARLAGENEKADAVDFWESEQLRKPEPTFCIDCGQPTTPGKGSARCPGCWEDRCGQMTEEEMQECRLDQQDEAERRGSTVCPHMREWLDCSECRAKQSVFRTCP